MSKRTEERDNPSSVTASAVTPSPQGEGLGGQIARATAPAAPEAFQGSGEEFYALAPKLSDADLEEINRLFRPFIFRIARKEEYWTSCCRKHVNLRRERTVTPEMLKIMEKPHTPEPDVRWEKLRNPESKERVTCPHCGAEATLKELGCTGKRMNLWQWRRAVVFRWHEGALWGLGVQAYKDYTSPDGPMQGKDRLTMLPRVDTTSVNRFRPGLAEEISRGWWNRNASWPKGVTWQEKPAEKGKPCLLGQPFGNCQDYGTGYDVVGWDEIGKSPFRYIDVREIYRRTWIRPMQTLTTACFFADKIEMLHKLGLDAVIKDYISRGVKNHWMLDWNASRAKDFLRLPLRTVRENIQSREGLEALRIWAVNKRRDDMESCLWAAREIMDYRRRERVRKLSKDWGLRLKRVVNYLNAQHKKGHSTETTVQIWLDYLDAAEHLGLDLANDVIRMPRSLQAAHDERTVQWADLQHRERAARAKKENEKKENAYAKRYKTLSLRYECSYGGLCVVVPLDAEEIVAEGKALKHCVGGYAGRHLDGKTTILFLRREDHPGVPMATIEINGTTIRQAHGYRNELESTPENPNRKPVQTLYKEFFTVWEDWLKRGSPRDKDGKPIFKQQGEDKTERKAG